MAKTKRKKRAQRKSLPTNTHIIISISVIVLILGIFFFSNISTIYYSLTAFAGLSSSCDSQVKRPCYDKKTSRGISLLGTKASNTFNACINNSAPNNYGEFIMKTVVSDQEIVVYCHDGKSDNFLRKFTGTSAGIPPPNPTPPPPMPTPTGSPTTSPFMITSPNGSEQWPFGSSQVITWTGGEPTLDWPIYLSIIDETRTQTLRELIINTPNDQGENWIADLPLGNYILYGQGCRGCLSTSQWDYSDMPFSVVPGSAIGKIETTNPANQSLVVFSASGGETWNTNSSQTIKWSGGTPDWQIAISLIDVNANQSYTTLYTGLANDGAENWTVPAYIPSGLYKIYVSCTNCGSAPAGYTGGYYAYSFKSFQIAP